MHVCVYVWVYIILLKAEKYKDLKSLTLFLFHICKPKKNGQIKKHFDQGFKILGKWKTRLVNQTLQSFEIFKNISLYLPPLRLWQKV